MVKIKIYKIQMINNKIEGKFEIVIDEILLHYKYPKILFKLQLFLKQIQRNKK